MPFHANHPISLSTAKRPLRFRFWRRALAGWLAVVTLVVGVLPAGHAPLYAASPAPSPAQETGAQAAPAEEADWAECETVEPEALRAELNQVSQGIFAAEQNQLDIAGMVARQWTLVGMDAAIDQAVFDAAEQVRADTEFWDQFLSGWSPAQAEILTRQVAEQAFASTTFRSAIDELSAGVAVELSEAIAALSAQSATQATLCLQQYIGSRYSTALVAVFTEALQAETDAVMVDAETPLDAGILSVLDQHRRALGGVGVIIAGEVAKRITARLATGMSRRVAGRITGRVLGKAGTTVIPAVGWVVGAGLIVYDVIENREGALPYIESELRGPEVKDAIRTEIAGLVADELRLEMPHLARETANELYASWLDFQRQYRQVLSLAEDDPRFNALLAQAEDPMQVAALVDVALAELEPAELDAALAEGTLARALLLPQSSYVIFQHTGSPGTLLAWSERAGSALDQVVELEIYKHLSPDDLSREGLQGLLAVASPAAIARLVLLDPAELDALLQLATPHVRSLAQELSHEELAWLGAFLPELDRTQTNQLVASLVDTPELVATLRAEGAPAQVRQARDVDAVLRFLAAPVTLSGMGADLLSLVTGGVSFGLFRAKYGLWATILAVGAPLLLFLALLQSVLGWLLRPLRFLGGRFRRSSHPHDR